MSIVTVVNKQHQEFLNLLRLPASITCEEAGILLGLSAESVAILITCGFLKPLGRQLAQNAPRRLAAVTIEALARDADQLSKMHYTLSTHWKARNKAKARARPGAGVHKSNSTVLRDSAEAA